MSKIADHQAEYEKLGFIRVNLNCEDCARLAGKIRELETQLATAQINCDSWERQAKDCAAREREARKEAREWKARYDGLNDAHASVVKQLEALEQT